MAVITLCVITMWQSPPERSDGTLDLSFHRIYHTYIHTYTRKYVYKNLRKFVFTARNSTDLKARQFQTYSEPYSRQEIHH
mgnify:CR=1